MIAAAARAWPRPAHAPRRSPAPPVPRRGHADRPGLQDGQFGQHPGSGPPCRPSFQRGLEVGPGSSEHAPAAARLGAGLQQRARAVPGGCMLSPAPVRRIASRQSPRAGVSPRPRRRRPLGPVASGGQVRGDLGGVASPRSSAWASRRCTHAVRPGRACPSPPGRSRAVGSQPSGPGCASPAWPAGPGRPAPRGGPVRWPGSAGRAGRAGRAGPAGPAVPAAGRAAWPAGPRALPRGR